METELERRLVDVVHYLDSEQRHMFANRICAAVAELQRLRALLEKAGIDPERCQEYPKGEQCALKHGHEGGCKWARGD